MQVMRPKQKMRPAPMQTAQVMQSVQPSGLAPLMRSTDEVCAAQVLRPAHVMKWMMRSVQVMRCKWCAQAMRAAQMKERSWSRGRTRTGHKTNRRVP